MIVSFLMFIIKKDVGKEAQRYVLANWLWPDGAPEAVRLHFSRKKVAI